MILVFGAACAAGIVIFMLVHKKEAAKTKR